LEQVTASDGTPLTYTTEYSRCGECGDEFYTRSQSLAASRARANALRAHENLLGPSEIRAFREKYGLTQEKLERLLGVGAKTVVRWERGTVAQGRAADSLLRILAKLPGALEFLAEQNGLAGHSSTLGWAEPAVKAFGDLSALSAPNCFAYALHDRDQFPRMVESDPEHNLVSRFQLDQRRTSLSFFAPFERVSETVQQLFVGVAAQPGQEDKSTDTAATLLASAA